MPYSIKKKSHIKKNGGGIKYVGRKINSSYHLSPVIFEIEDLLYKIDTTLIPLSLTSAFGFIYLLDFTSEDPPIFRSDIIDENNNPLSLINRLKYNTGKPINNLIIKFIIIDDKDDYLPDLKMYGKNLMKTTERENSVIKEIQIQNILYTNIFRLSGRPLLPNIIGSAILSSKDATNFLSLYLDTEHNRGKYSLSEMNDSNHSLLYIKQQLSKNGSFIENRKLAIIIMEKIDGYPIRKLLRNNPIRNIDSVKLIPCIKVISIGLIIIATSKVCPYDAHGENWLYDPVTNNVSAIDFGRTQKITSDNISNILLNFVNNGYRSYVKTDVNKMKIISRLALFFNINITGLDDKIMGNEIYEKMNELTDEIVHLDRSCEEFYITDDTIRTSQGWQHEPRMILIHKCILFWALVDGAINASFYQHPYIQFMEFLQEIWNNSNITGIFDLTYETNISLPKFISRIRNQKTIDYIRYCYEEISNFIKEYTTNEQQIGLRFPKQIMEIYNEIITKPDRKIISIKDDDLIREIEREQRLKELEHITLETETPYYQFNVNEPKKLSKMQLKMKSTKKPPPSIYSSIKERMKKLQVSSKKSRKNKQYQLRSLNKQTNITPTYNSSNDMSTGGRKRITRKKRFTRKNRL